MIRKTLLFLLLLIILIGLTSFVIAELAVPKKNDLYDLRKYNTELNVTTDGSNIPRTDIPKNPTSGFRYMFFWQATCQHVAHDEWNIYTIDADHPDGWVNPEGNATYSWYAGSPTSYNPDLHSWRSNPNMKSLGEIQAMGEGAYIYPGKKEPTAAEDGYQWQITDYCIYRQGWWGTGVPCNEPGYMKVTIKDDGAVIPPPVSTHPIADIRSPYRVTQGDDVTIDASGSYDPDGTITNYSYSLPSHGGTISGSKGTIWFTTSGTLTVGVTVTDNTGLSDDDSTKIMVDPPYPWAVISHTGLRLENHKITLSSLNSTTPKHYPIDESKTVWEITPVSGVTVDDIKYRGELSGSNLKDVMFKKAGSYKVKLVITNTAGYSGSSEVTLDIGPDLEPIADISVRKSSIRDQVDSYGVHYGVVDVYDISNCPDGDKIGRIRLTFRYDSDNDGSFDDETRAVLYDSIDNPSGGDIYYTDRPDVLLYNSSARCVSLAYPGILTGSNDTIGLTMFDIEVWDKLDDSNTFPEYLLPADVKTDNTFDW